MTAPAAPITDRAGTELDADEVKAMILGGAKRRGATIAGVADPALLDGQPEGMRPVDLLPQTKTMIVLGGAAPRAGEWSSPRSEVLETLGTADRIGVTASAVARQIEDDLGYYALSVPTATDQDDKPFMSFVDAAVAAGVGSPSLAGPALNPDQGFVYLAVILTSLPLPFDEPLPTPACPAPSCVDMYADRGVTPCTDVCNIDAGGCLGGEIVDGLVIGRKFDAERCRDRVYHYWVPGYQKALEAALDEPDARRRKMILYGSYFTRTMWSITYSNVSQGQCFECVKACPVGSDGRQLK
ncbi:MAG: hypothetical protein AAF567_22815 [Actinomycetota bacterium]